MCLSLLQDVLLHVLSSQPRVQHGGAEIAVMMLLGILEHCVKDHSGVPPGNWVPNAQLQLRLSFKPTHTSEYMFFEEV